MQNLSQLLQNWNISGDIIDISNKGFSGSRIYRISGNNKSYLLKGYPDHIKLGNLLKTHEILAAIKSHGIRIVPAPYKTSSGETVVEFESRVWDLVEFFEGGHLHEDPNDVQFIQLIKNVAGIHRATKDILIDDHVRRTKQVRLGEFLEGFDWWDNLSEGKVDRLKSQNLYELIAEFIEFSKEYFNKYLKDFKWEDAFIKLPQSIIHRDLTKRNVLFVGDKLTGIIDFETVKYGTRLDDIARLAIEFTNGSKSKIETLLTEYKKINLIELQEEKSLYTWIVLMNLGINLWILKYYAKLDALTQEDCDYVIARMQKANLIYSKINI